MFWRFVYSEQLRAVFEWLSGIVRDADVVLVRKDGRDAWYRFSFPLRLGDMPRRAKAQSGEETFVVDFRTFSRSAPAGEWARIFSSPELALFERKSRATGASPLRWGLEEEEKKAALRLARETIAEFLTTGKRSMGQLRGFPPRFSSKANVDVAFWVRGTLRGSQIVGGRTLGEGIAEAARRASRDPRFKPPESEDLPALRIQVTLLHDLRIPLSRAEKAKNAIYAEKGYRLEREGKVGWYLPEVLNARRFRNLTDFLGGLALEKARLARGSSGESVVRVFEVDDFIESVSGGAPLSLFGPVPKNSETDVLTKEALARHGTQAASWLVALQEQDGNIPAVLEPLSGRRVQIDWVRLPFTALALSEFGAATGKEEYRSAAQRTFAYLERHLFARDGVAVPHRELALAYFGQLALSQKDSTGAERVARELRGRLFALDFEPILYSQAATFFVREHPTTAGRLLDLVQNRFLEKGNAPRSLAAWAEAAHAAFLYSRAAREGSFGDLYREVKEWLTGHQLENGAFPDFPGSRFAYTRGTGKIFEVLALEPEANRDALQRSLRWLFAMHYSEENTFFVPERIRHEVIGGFRHDDLNHEAWIDAAGHFLLGAARILGGKDRRVS